MVSCSVIKDYYSFRFIISIPRDSINLRLRPFALAALIAIIGVMIARVGLDGLCTDSYIWVMLGVGVVIPWLAKRSPAVAQTGSSTDY